MLNFLRNQIERLEAEGNVVLLPSLIQLADAMTVIGCVPVRGLEYLLKHPDKYIVAPIHKDDVPRDPYNLYADVLYLRPFSDVAQAISAPFGVDTVYAVKKREPKPRTGAYKLPAPKR
jgi:hypothetical protein